MKLLLYVFYWSAEFQQFSINSIFDILILGEMVEYYQRAIGNYSRVHGGKICSILKFG